MGYTKFGEFARVLRIKNHEIMGDMAKKLNVSVPFLSSVETGKKNVPSGWINDLVKLYHLSDDEKNDLVQAVEESKIQVKINLQNADFGKRQIALQFARSFDDMDEETAMKIADLLNKRSNK